MSTCARSFCDFQIESSVALKPFLMKLTRSELHALMTSGFATVAGTVIAAYVEFGVSKSCIILRNFKHEKWV